MPALRDLVCTGPARHIERDVYFKRVDDPSTPCPTCGAPRQLCLLFGGAPSLSLFKPFYHDGYGMINDQSDFDALRIRLAQIHGGDPKDYVVAVDSRTEARTTADEYRHRAYSRRKRKGIDSQQLSEIRRTVRKYGVNPLNGRVAKRPRKETP